MAAQEDDDHAPTEQFRCSQCSASYMRQDHLHRHESTHNQHKSCVCEFCSTRFHRRDILRRHYKKCKERGDRSIPTIQFRGRRRQACDWCASHKLACDAGQPCKPCANKNHPCLRHRASITSAHDPVAIAPTEATEDDSNSIIQSPIIPTSESSGCRPQKSTAMTSPAISLPTASHGGSSRFALSHVPVPFLSTIVGTDAVGLVDVFGYTSTPPEPPTEHPLPPLSHATYSTDAGQDYYRLPEPASNSPMSGQNMPFCPDMNTSFDMFGLNTMPIHLPVETTSDLSAHNPLGRGSAGFAVFGQNSIGVNDRQSLVSQDILDPVSRQIYEMVMQLTNTSITLPKGHYARAPSVKIDQADTFFTSSNVQLFVQTYFHHFHPHFSVIHRPSFDIKTAPLRTLLAVCLAGSLYSSLSPMIGRCKSYLDLAEELIFRDTALRRLTNGNHVGEADASSDNFVSHLEVLQAGFIILILQNWEGNPAARRRVRLERLHQLISLARAVRLTSFKPTWRKQLDLIQRSNWIHFAREESCLQTLHYIFIFDSTLGIIHNYPPKFVLGEMGMDFPCPQDLFEATNGNNYLRIAASSDLQQHGPYSLRTILALLIGDDVSTEAKACLVKLSAFHLFILIHALHHVLWHCHHSSILGVTSSSTMERALSRWKNLWDWGKRPSSVRLSRRAGFMLHAEEYWWLARLKLHEGSSGEPAIFEDDQMDGIRRLLEVYCSQHEAESLEFDV